MNFRKDIFERMTYIVKTETNRKPNYAKLARQFNCDYRTVKQYYEAASNGIRQLPERKIPKKTDGYEQIIEEKLKTGAPAIAIYQYLREEKGFDGSYSTIKQYVHNYHGLRQRQAVIRFETTPGLQAQVDWKESLRFKTTSGEEILAALAAYIREVKSPKKTAAAAAAFVCANVSPPAGRGDCCSVGNTARKKASCPCGRTCRRPGDIGEIIRRRSAEK